MIDKLIVILAVSTFISACGAYEGDASGSGDLDPVTDFGTKKTAESTNILPQPCGYVGCVGPTHVCVTAAQAGGSDLAGECAMICIDDGLLQACFDAGGVELQLTDGTLVCADEQPNVWGAIKW